MNDLEESASEIRGKSTWLAPLRTRVNALPVWKFWLMFFVVVFLNEEIFRFLFKEGKLLASIWEAALWASAMSLVHWLGIK
jgi:hypothetical protein